MKRKASTCAMVLAAVVGLHGQGVRLPRPLNTPEIVEPTITVTGIGGKGVTLAGWDLSKLPQQTVKTTDHGAP